MRARQLPKPLRDAIHMSENLKNKKGVNTAIATMVVLGVSLAVPIFGSGIASAATVDTWDRIAQCESGGRWNLSYGDADSTGGLQIQTRTWNDYKSGISSAPAAYLASKEDQIRVAQKILADQGSSAWAVTTNGSACSGVSLTVSPEPVFGTTVPTTPTQPSQPSQPTQPSQPSTPTTPSSPATGSEKYTVKSGDTLSKIAGYKKVPGGWQVIYAANKSVIGSNPNMIYPGQKLVIPTGAKKYTVKSGDTVSGIAASFKVSSQALYSANKAVIGPDINKIVPGQVLTIPGGVSAPSAPSTPSTPVPTTKSWTVPTDVMNVTQRYGNPSSGYGLGYHTGVDITRPAGTPVKAVSAATVVHSGYGYAGAAYGLHVVLRLADGHYALYGHLSASTVSAGQSVAAGQMIGNVGSTGNSSGPHLHFEIRNSPNQYSAGVFQDPIAFLRSKGVTV